VDKILTVGQTVSTLESLRNAVDSLVARESSLLLDRDRELEAIRRKYDLLKARSRQNAEEQSNRAGAALEARRDGAKERTALRQQWIEKSYERSKKALDESVEQKRSQQQYENQKDLLQANRDHDNDCDASEKTLKSYLLELDNESERFEIAKEKAWNFFRSDPMFKNQIQEGNSQTSDRPSASDEYALLENLRKGLGGLETSVCLSFRVILVRFFSLVPVWLLLLFLSAVGGGAYYFPQLASSLGLESDLIIRGAALGAMGVFGGFVLGLVLARGVARKVVNEMRASTELIHFCRASATESQEANLGTIRQALHDVEERLETAWKETKAKADSQFLAGSAKLEAQVKRLRDLNLRAGKNALDRLRTGGEVDVTGKGSLNQVEKEQQALESDVVGKFDNAMGQVVSEWQDQVPTALEKITRSRLASDEEFVGWDSDTWNAWGAPSDGDPAGRFAKLEVGLSQFVSSLPKDPRLSWNVTEALLAPLAVNMPLGESVLFESDGAGPHEVIEAINAIVMRLLTTSPVGRMRFTLIDPVGLGQSFAGLMHLTDYDDQLVNRRIWTQASQIEQCLKDLTEHMEKITQMYLRNEYETLAEYNEAAGNIAEKYHVLVIADFPVGFSESSLRRLQSIAVSGPRCGVFLLVHRDRRQSVLDEAVVDDLREHSNWFEARPNGYQFGGLRWSGVKLIWDRHPDSQAAIDIIHQVGKASVDSNRVEVPFSQVVPKADELWSLETGSTLRVPIGRTGASKLQYLVLGKGTQQHALIAGKTGSGKSTLFHVLVTNLALWCRPDQVEFYLVDFKKGVEFKCYATHRLPHARVVAIESDREFGLSVLERVDQELRRRGDLFRQHGVQDLASFQKLEETEPLPRTLVLIDEFQEYFVEDDRVAQNAAVLLDRIVRQGRAFGIHVILGSQTLGGAYTLARTTFAQMVVRVALQCDEADSYLIMDENNSAPRLLSRPGEGIYNDSGGAAEGNSPFQTVWLSDSERDSYLSQVSALVDERQWKGAEPVVFEGNAPAKVEENQELASRLRSCPEGLPSLPEAWLGAPNSIKGPTAATFGLQNGSHLLVLGQNEEMALSLVLCSLVSLAAQYPVDAAEFVIVDAFPDHSRQREILDRVLAVLPQRTRTLRDNSLDELMAGLGRDLDIRSGTTETSPATFLVVIGLQSFKKLRPEDEFSLSVSDDSTEINPGDVLDRIVKEGPSVGVRALVTVDSYNSSQRFLSRKALSEFEMRVLFQMSANDSAALIDSTKASQLGLHRALFYNERKGHLETFRPYAMPDGDWLAKVGRSLAGRASEQGVSQLDG
jgi:DNA segregation ATPase FtsK/SpoIIIE, S-DNA-T family